ncbi:MAG: diguanylate cyclase [Chthonomonas sp.]|nr:diguanylate cyclase [Chthonomonas sp.]
MNILVADDDSATRLLLGRMIEREGHHVTTAKNGAEALELFKESRFDVVISDWMMPVMDGLELCRELRYTEGLDYAYFIMVTAKGHREERLNAIEAGVDDLINKPLDSEELQARLKVAARILRTQTELRQKSEENRQLANVLEMANRRVSELFKNLPVACLTIDPTGIVMEINQRAERLLGVTSGSVWMQPFYDSVVPSKHRRKALQLASRAGEGEMILDYPWQVELIGGELKSLIINTFPIRSPMGAIVGSAITFVDLTKERQLTKQIRTQLAVQRQTNAELKILSDKLDLLAKTDGLTGLFNVRTFKAFLTTAMENAAKKGTPLSILLTDVDKFKSFNDEFGHLVGDEVLRKVSSTMRAIVDQTPGAMVARYGGEEFIAAIPGMEASDAVEYANQLRLAIQDQEWTYRQVTSSFGVATFSPDLDTVESFVKLADDALYASKENGRNRVTHAQELRSAAA